jgi:hypothetical protein
MSSRLLALRRGKTGDTQRFSQSRPFNHDQAALVQTTVGPGLSFPVRSQVLMDPGTVQQFACILGGVFGFFTRPKFVPAPDGTGTLVVGNFTDTIGEPVPYSVTMNDFTGSFTTLVRRGDAETFGLATHPVNPDTVSGPAVRGRASGASLERLEFPMPDAPEPGDHPVIVALPNFLPIGPGLTFPHLLKVDDPASFRATFPLFEVYRQGAAYIQLNNAGYSVTKAGPLFHLPSLALEDDDVDPFATSDVRVALPRSMTQLEPTDPLYGGARDHFLAWSEAIYVEMGSAMDPEPAIGAAGMPFTAEHLRAVMEPLVPKAKTFMSSSRTIARCKLLLAAPNPGGDRAVLPDIKDDFKAYTSVPSSATAADDLKELVRSRLAVANGSDYSIDKDVTLEAENITLAFSDRLRTFTWLSEKLANSSAAGARSSLGLMQFLTPDREALALVAEGDREAATLLMSNSSNSSAQLDASKSSKLYTGGRLTTFRHTYEAFCNLRLLLSVLVEDLTTPMLLQKMLVYVSLLVDRSGRLFWEIHRNKPGLALHPWQDLQTILSAFCRVATDSQLYSAVARGEPIAISNYQVAIDVSDALTADLRAILNGNGLGKFGGIPVCAPWFSGYKAIPAAKSPAGGEPKRQRTVAPPAPHVADRAAGNRVPRVVDQLELDRKKGFGCLEFDSTAAGTTRLPTCNVYFKKRGARTPERLCMPFMTKGYACDRPDCKLPHLTDLGALSAGEKAKLIEFVRRNPGLSWVEGRAPPGTA